MPARQHDHSRCDFGVAYGVTQSHCVRHLTFYGYWARVTGFSRPELREHWLPEDRKTDAEVASRDVRTTVSPQTPLQMLTYNPRQVLQAQKSNVHHTPKRTIDDDEEPAATAWSAQGLAEKVEEESKSWLDEPPGHLEFDKKAM